MDIIDPDRPSTSKYIEIPQSPSNTFEQPDLHVCEKRLREDPNASKIGSALDDAFMSEYQAEYLSDIRKKEVSSKRWNTHGFCFSIGNFYFIQFLIYINFE